MGENTLTLPEMTQIWQLTLQWQPSEAQQQQFESLYTEILAGNRQLNLTRITSPEDFWEKHLWDSMVGVSDWFSQDIPLRVVDIGTGAGFPGIPVAIAFPHWQLTLLDSTRKKIAFVQHLAQKLNIDNVITIGDRVEKLGQQKAYREKFDLALIRAVATASVCAEYAIPMVKIGGVVVLYRGHWQDEETKDLSDTLVKLGAEIEAIKKIHTPITDSVRHCIYLRKLKKTSSKYPRDVGIPAQQPL